MLNQHDDAFWKDPKVQRVRNDIKNAKLNTEPPAYSRYKAPDYNYDNYIQSYFMRKEKIGNFPVIKLKLGERPMGDPNKFAKALASVDDTWLISDLHLSSFGTRARDLSYTINSYVSSSKNLIIVGNLLHPKDTKQFSLIMRFLSLLNTKNVFLILGNTDIFSVQTYIDMGFVYVTDRAERTVLGKKIIYSYYPIPALNNNASNIFGFSNAYTGNYPTFITKNNHYCVSAGEDADMIHKLRDVAGKLHNGGDYNGTHFQC